MRKRAKAQHDRFEVRCTPEFSELIAALQAATGDTTRCSLVRRLLHNEARRLKVTT